MRAKQGDIRLLFLYYIYKVHSYRSIFSFTEPNGHSLHLLHIDDEIGNQLFYLLHLLHIGDDMRNQLFYIDDFIFQLTTTILQGTAMKIELITA